MRDKQKSIHSCISWLILIIFIAVIILIASLELLVAMKITQNLTHLAMWMGAIIWLLVASIAWTNKLAPDGINIPDWLLLIITVITVNALFSLYRPTIFIAFTLWANAMPPIMAVLFIGFLSYKTID